MLHHRQELQRYCQNHYFSLGTIDALEQLVAILAVRGAMDHGDLMQVCQVGTAALKKAVDAEILVKIKSDRRTIYRLGQAGWWIAEEMQLPANPLPLLLTTKRLAQLVAWGKFCVQMGLDPVAPEGIDWAPGRERFSAVNKANEMLVFGFDQDAPERITTPLPLLEASARIDKLGVRRDL